jgi:hypothetical protein
MRLIMWKSVAALRIGTTFIVGMVCSCSAMALCYPGLGDCTDPNKPSAAPLPTPTPPQQPMSEFYYVGPVFPPDPWLALRSEPSSTAGYRITKMPEGTLFRRLDVRGEWYKVQLQDGQTGWANSRWIKCCRYLRP